MYPCLHKYSILRLRVFVGKSGPKTIVDLTFCKNVCNMEIKVKVVNRPILL